MHTVRPLTPNRVQVSSIVFILWSKPATHPGLRCNSTKVVRALLSNQTNKELIAMTRFKTILSRALPVLLLVAIAVPSQAATFTFTATLSGPNEAPPNASPGTGFGTIVFDNVAHTLAIDISFSGLLGNTTASHLHCCIAPPGATGVATQTPTFVSFPLGVTSGTYSHIFDTTQAATFNAPFVTANGGTALGAEAALLAGALAGNEYLYVHSSFAPGGEIRGFLVAVPESTTAALLGIGIAGILGFAWRKRLSV